MYFEKTIDSLVIELECHDVIHIFLNGFNDNPRKYSRCILKSKSHDSVKRDVKFIDKSSLVLVFLCYAYLGIH